MKGARTPNVASRTSSEYLRSGGDARAHQPDA